MHTQFWSQKLKGRHCLGDLGFDGRIILEWISKKWDLGVWIKTSDGLVGIQK
jgi:hypothetical protein